MISTANAWLAIGFLGQAFFSMRFLIQWIHSERMKKSLIPVAFWYFSLGGGVTLFAYALYREDPVFIVGQGAGLFVYGRNLYFIFRERHQKKAALASGNADGSDGGA
jgi:lipid-A-disaccharide synthase-like uncharacterized protein